ncbi:MAG: DUF86 domain-containing protein [Chloroflexi bacterium]|nr:DUF86 domain-containing protein [Chloroflexota bacterium]
MGRDQEYLLDMLTAAKLAVAYVSGWDQESFLQDTQLQDSVIRRLEIIGEAARRISSETQAGLPSISWKDMIGMRNRMIHNYDDIDLYIVWQTVQHDLPRLIALIEPLFPADKPGA